MVDCRGRGTVSERLSVNILVDSGLGPLEFSKLFTHTIATSLGQLQKNMYLFHVRFRYIQKHIYEASVLGRIRLRSQMQFVSNQRIGLFTAKGINFMKHPGRNRAQLYWGHLSQLATKVQGQA